ncbi:MAG: OprO/OprP family phosphate-selective porin [Candidatus Methylomirabilales bacterium]
MKKISWVFLAMTSLLTLSSPALAAEKKEEKAVLDEVLDILKDKGQITEEKYQELRARAKKEGAGKVLASYDKGFYIKSADEQHLLRLNARTRVQFTLFPPDTPVSNTSFRVRRFRPEFSGYVFKIFEYKVSGELADATNILEDGYVNIRYRPELQLQLGQFKAPFSREQLTSSRDIETIERSVIGDELVPARDLGVQLHGRFFQNIVTYGIGIFQGVGRNTFDNNDDKDWVGRVVMNPFITQKGSPLRGLSLGANFQVGRQPFSTNGARTRFITRADRAIFFNATTRGLRQRYGGDIRYDYGPFSFQGEFIYERQRRDSVLTAAGAIATTSAAGVQDASDIERFGGYAQMGYFVWGTKHRGIQLVAKYERFEADDTGDVGALGDVPSQSLDHYTFGLNWFINDNAKLQVNGILEDLERPITAFGQTSRGEFLDRTLNWVLLTQLQVWF